MPPSTPRVVVHKFGGAALADAAAVLRASALLADDVSSSRCVVVTSALQGVTNALVEIARLATNGEHAEAKRSVRELRERHHDVTRETAHAAGGEIDAIFDALEATLERLRATETDRAAARDEVLAVGERVAARIVAATLTARGTAAEVVDATLLVRTDGRHGDAAPDLECTDAQTRAELGPRLARGAIVVVPGFIGAAPDGSVVTLGRGGSDLTAALLARALNAREVTLWKDVAGCMTADPRIVPDARVVPTLDAREASELAYYGAKVLHPRTLIPLRAGMTLRLRPFADPSLAGTTIVVGREVGGAPVRAVSAIPRQALLAVSGAGMLGVPGMAARVFDALAAARVSVSLISQASSEQSICFTIPGERAEEIVAALRAAFAEELTRREVDEIGVRHTLATIAVVGSGMARTPGVSARIFGAVANAGVNVVAIAQGSSERNISFVVEESDAPAAMRAVHDAFRLGKIGGGRVRRTTEPADVILLGTGRVSRALIAQMREVARRGAPLRIVGLIDSEGFVFHPRGLAPRQLASLVLHKERGGSLARANGGRAGCALDAVTHMAAHALSRPVLVDVATGATSAALQHGVLHGMDVVMANKVPLASELASARELMREARKRGRRVLHEATVGAGLPIIDTLQQLHASGDRVDSVDSSPSGTMGHLFSEMGRGSTFSDAVRRAMALGYTEPDPRDDLSGLDVARKGLILGRMLGFRGEMRDVALESLVPDTLRDVSRDDFLASLEEQDPVWERRVREARERGEVLRYRARSTRGGVRVGLVSVPAGSPLASLDGTDNLFVFTTARYRNRPLVVSGPGAGAEVTAAGVLGDVLRLVTR